MSIRANTDAAGLNERITLERKVITRGPKGEIIETWTFLAEVWSRVDGMKAGERFTDAAIRSVDAYTIWIRAEVYQELALTQRDRVVWRGRFLDIKDIPDQQLRGRLTALFTQAGLNQG